MTASAAPRWTAWQPGPRRFLALLCSLLLVACGAALVGESTRRRAIAEDAGRSLAALPPAVLATAGILEDSDGAALIVAEGLLDARASKSAAALPPADAAQALVLETVGRRPASAHARLLLGLSATDAGAADQWKKPLALAASAAPGLDRAAAALAQKYLVEWPKLSVDARSEGEAAIRRAFLDEAFLRSSFRLALQRLGPDAAVGLVPADPGALEAASRVSSAAGAARASQLLAERRKSVLSEGDSGPRP